MHIKHGSLNTKLGTGSTSQRGSQHKKTIDTSSMSKHDSDLTRNILNGVQVKLHWALDCIDCVRFLYVALLFASPPPPPPPFLFGSIYAEYEAAAQRRGL